MIGINIPGLVATMVAIGPRYAVLTLAAVFCQELGRVILAISTGSEVHQVWLGGFFGFAEGNGAFSALLGWFGPLWSLIIGSCLVGSQRPPLSSLLNPASTYRKPLGSVMFKLAIGSAAVALVRMLPQ